MFVENPLAVAHMKTMADMFAPAAAAFRKIESRIIEFTGYKGEPVSVSCRHKTDHGEHVLTLSVRPVEGRPEITVTKSATQQTMDKARVSTVALRRAACNSSRPATAPTTDPDSIIVWRAKMMPIDASMPLGGYGPEHIRGFSTRSSRAFLAALDKAKAIANRWNHCWVGTEHVLAAVVDTSVSSSSLVMRAFGRFISKDGLLKLIQKRAGAGKPHKIEIEPPYTPRMAGVIEAAISEAKRRERQAGTDCLLWALAKSGDSVAGSICEIFDVKPEMFLAPDVTPVLVRADELLNGGLGVEAVAERLRIEFPELKGCGVVVFGMAI